MLALLIALLSANPMPKPSAADSLAGVIARLTGTDSGRVSKIRWMQDVRPYLEVRPAQEYRYQLPAGTQVSRLATVPIVALTEGRTITFATDKNGMPWSNDETVLKHEMVHAMTGRMDHPNDLFLKVELYHGR
jgi:hypothetical protein